MQVLVLSGAFCIFLAIYETFEYVFCYDDEKKLHRRLFKLSLRARDLATGNNGSMLNQTQDMSEVSRLLETAPGEEAIPLDEVLANHMEENILFDRTFDGKMQEAQPLVEQANNESGQHNKCQDIAQRFFTEGLGSKQSVEEDKIDEGFDDSMQLHHSSDLKKK